MTSQLATPRAIARRIFRFISSKSRSVDTSVRNLFQRNTRTFRRDLQRRHPALVGRLLPAFLNPPSASSWPHELPVHRGVRYKAVLLDRVSLSDPHCSWRIQCHAPATPGANEFVDVSG